MSVRLADDDLTPLWARAAFVQRLIAPLSPVWFPARSQEWLDWTQSWERRIVADRRFYRRQFAAWLYRKAKRLDPELVEVGQRRGCGSFEFVGGPACTQLHIGAVAVARARLSREVG